MAMTMLTVIGELRMTKSRYTIRFIREEDSAEVTLELISHYTCIYGKESGEGKTEFIARVEEGMNDGSVRVESPFPFAIATPGNIEALLSNEQRQILMLDESVVLRDELIRLANNSIHLLICITRAVPLKNAYPLDGIYLLSRTDNGWFQVTRDMLFKRLKKLPEESFERIITEAQRDRSEHELLSLYLKNVESAGGHNRIEQLLRRSDGDMLVFMDLGNIGNAYGILHKRVAQNPRILFYNYDAFEQLLTDSLFVKEFGKEVELDPFDYLSLERYYESLLEQMTKGTEIEYKHGERLPAIILDKDNLSRLLDSDVGRLLLEYIQREQDVE